MFTPAELQAQFNFQLSFVDELGAIPSYDYQAFLFFQKHPDELGIYPPEPITDRLRDAPDIFALYHILRSISSDQLVIAFADRFRQLIGRPEESLDDMITESGVGHSVDKDIKRPMLLAMMSAFTPLSDRDMLTPDVVEDGEVFRPHEFLQIRTYTPDLTSYGTPAERLDAVITMFSMTFDDAFEWVAQQYGTTTEQLRHLEDSSQLKKQLRAKAFDYYVHTSFVAVLKDMSGEGYGSVFNVHPETHGGPVFTERAKCTGESFVDAYFVGLGRALRANRDSVLKMITSFQTRRPKGDPGDDWHRRWCTFDGEGN